MTLRLLFLIMLTLLGINLSVAAAAETCWQDSFKNSGTGTIRRSGPDVLLSLKTAHVADSRCLAFYGENIRLKPAGKK
jgi:hypothetical protein